MVLCVKSPSNNHLTGLGVFCTKKKPVGPIEKKPLFVVGLSVFSHVIVKELSLRGRGLLDWGRGTEFRKVSHWDVCGIRNFLGIILKLKRKLSKIADLLLKKIARNMQRNVSRRFFASGVRHFVLKYKFPIGKSPETSAKY